MPAATGSLRSKLVLWFALVFLAIDAGVVAAVSIVRIDTFRTELLAKARGWAVNLASNYNVLDPEWTHDAPGDLEADREAREVLQPNWPFDTAEVVAGYVFRDSSGRPIGTYNVRDPQVLWRNSVFEGVVAGPLVEVRRELGPADSQQVLGTSDGIVLVTIPIYRLDPNRYEYVQVAFPQPLVEPTLASLVDILLLGLLIGGTIAPLAAWLVAGRVVAPIEQLARAAREVRPDRIGERIHVDPTSSEIAELQRELNEALARLELGYRAQERFIGDVSHELRTPLAVLLAEAGLLHAGRTEPKRYHEFVASTEEELRRLARLVEGFLRLTRVEMTREPLLTEEVEVNDLVVDATRHVDGYARRGGVHLVPHLALPDDDGDGPLVYGDPELLRTMLENLVRNAVRFSPTGAPIVLSVDRDGDTVRIVVRDSGPGIPPENLERVFHRFVRLEQKGEREKGGAGIGLAIARNIAVLHRGDIRASNAPTGGCVMTVTLPLGRPATTDASPEEDDAATA